MILDFIDRAITSGLKFRAHSRFDAAIGLWKEKTSRNILGVNIDSDRKVHFIELEVLRFKYFRE